MSEHTKYLKTIFAYFITSNDTCDCSYRKFKNDRTRVELSIEWCRSESWGGKRKGIFQKKTPIFRRNYFQNRKVRRFIILVKHALSVTRKGMSLFLGHLLNNIIYIGILTNTHI